MALLRSSLEPLHYGECLRFIDLLEQSLVHGLILDFSLHASLAGFGKGGRGCYPLRSSVLRWLDPEFCEKREQGLCMPILGLDDIHERSD